jgi:hypothetical protein
VQAILDEGRVEDWTDEAESLSPAVSVPVRSLRGEQYEQHPASLHQVDRNFVIRFPLSRRRHIRSDAEVRLLFDQLKRQWRADSQYVSSTTKLAIHPAYQRIIGLGLQAVPLILQELREEPHQWFWALASIVGEDVGAGQETVAGAAETWLRWGRSQEFID